MSHNYASEDLQKDAISSFDYLALQALRSQRELYKEQENCKFLEQNIKELDAKFIAVSTAIAEAGASRQKSYKKERALQINIESTAKAKQLVDEVNSDLQRQLHHSRAQIKQYKKDNESLFIQSEGKWDRFVANYLQYPLAAKRHQLTIQNKQDRIKIAQCQQDVKELKEKVATKKKIKEIKTQIEVRNIARQIVRRNKLVVEVATLQDRTQATEKKITSLREERQELLKRAKSTPIRVVRPVVLPQPPQVFPDVPLKTLQLPKLASPPRKVRCLSDIRLATNQIYTRLPQRLFSFDHYAATQGKSEALAQVPLSVASLAAIQSSDIQKQQEPPASSQLTTVLTLGDSNPSRKREKKKDATQPCQTSSTPAQDMTGMPMLYTQDKLVTEIEDATVTTPKKVKWGSSLECPTPKPSRRNAFKTLPPSVRPDLNVPMMRDSNAGSESVGNNSENLKVAGNNSHGSVDPKENNAQPCNKEQHTVTRLNVWQTYQCHLVPPQEPTSVERGPQQQNVAQKTSAQHTLGPNMLPRLQSEPTFSQSLEQVSKGDENVLLGSNSQESLNVSINQPQQPQNTSQVQSQEPINCSHSNPQDAANTSQDQSELSHYISPTQSQEAQNTSCKHQAQNSQSQELPNDVFVQSQEAHNCSFNQSQEVLNSSVSQTCAAQNPLIGCSQEENNTTKQDGSLTLSQESLSTFDKEAHWAYIRKLQESPERVFEPRRIITQQQANPPTPMNLEEKDVFHSHYFLQTMRNVQTNNPQCAVFITERAKSSTADSDKAATYKVVPDKLAADDPVTGAKSGDKEAVHNESATPATVKDTHDKTIAGSATAAKTVTDNATFDKSAAKGELTCEIAPGNIVTDNNDKCAFRTVTACQDMLDHTATVYDVNAMDDAATDPVAARQGDSNGETLSTHEQNNSMWMSPTQSVGILDMSYARFIEEMDTRMGQTNPSSMNLDDHTLNDSIEFSSPVVSPVRVLPTNPFGTSKSNTADSVSDFKFNFSSAAPSTTVVSGNNKPGGQSEQQPGGKPSDKFNFNFSSKPSPPSIFKLF